MAGFSLYVECAMEGHCGLESLPLPGYANFDWKKNDTQYDFLNKPNQVGLE